MEPKALTASVVSRILRDAGLQPQGGDYPRSRPALRVSRSVLVGSVRISADFDTPAISRRVAESAANVLGDAGLTIRRNPHDDTMMTVTR